MILWTAPSGRPKHGRSFPPWRGVLAKERAAGSAVAFTLDTHTEGYLSTQEGRLLPVPHCIRGTRGWELIPELDAADARLFEKGTFGSTELASYARAYDEVVLCGVCTDICVVSNALLIKAFAPRNARPGRGGGVCGDFSRGARSGAPHPEELSDGDPLNIREIKRAGRRVF